MGQSNTPDILERLARKTSNMPDIRELLGCIHSKLGGTESYAQMLVNDVDAAPLGSTQRLSFHNNYLAAVAKFGGDDDLANMTTEDIQEEARRLLAAEQEAFGAGQDETDD